MKNFKIYFFAALLLSGVVFMHKYNRVSNAEKEKILLKAKVAAAAICIERVKNLISVKPDITNIDYKHLKNQLTKMRRVNPSQTMFYSILAKNSDNDLFFLVDSEPPESKDYSPYGQIYSESSKELFNAFNSNKGIITGPVEDRWGKWISAVIPLNDEDGKAIAIFTADISAKSLYLRVLEELYLTIFAIIFFIILLFALHFYLLNKQKIEKNLYKSKERYRYLSYASFEAIFISENGICIEQNKRAELLFGYTNSEAIGKKATDFIAPEHRETVKNNIISQKNTPYEAVGLKKDGTTFPCIIHGKTMLYKVKSVRITSLTDTTKHKKMENLLSENQARLQAITQGAHDGIIMIDENGNISFWNPAATQIFGFKLDEVLGKNLHEMLAPSRYHEAHNAAFPGFVRTGKGNAIGKTLELKGLKKSGGEVSVELSLSSLFINNAWQAIGIIRDITDRKKNEKEREKMQLQLHHKEKLASIGTLSAGIAHEINNPLAIIMGNLELIKNKCKNLCNANCKENISIQEKACSRIATIVNGLRNYARSDTGTMEEINIHDAITDTIDLVKSIFRKENIIIETEFNCNFPQIKSNMGKMQQVIMNMLSNAKDAIKEVNKPGIIKIATNCFESHVTITVSDNGAGITKDQKTTIFDPFFTTKEPNKGTGLGLPISHSIISSFGGKITVESEKNIGTTFTITLPKNI